MSEFVADTYAALLGDKVVFSDRPCVEVVVGEGCVERIALTPFSYEGLPKEAAQSAIIAQLTGNSEFVDELMTVERVLALLGVSNQTLWRMRRAGTFPEPRKIGKRRVGNYRLVWSRSEVMHWLRERESVDKAGGFSDDPAVETEAVGV